MFENITDLLNYNMGFGVPFWAALILTLVLAVVAGKIIKSRRKQ